MSTSAVSSTSLNQQLQQYFQTRHSDLLQLGKALGSGDLASAQTAYNSIVSLGQTGPFAGGNSFLINQREQDFTAIGQALQSGNLAAAQQAFATLRSALAAPPSGPTSSSGPDIVLNLTSGSGSNQEPVTVNISSSDQVSVSMGDQTFNLVPNSNEQAFLAALGEPSSNNNSSSSASNGGISVSA